jgi:hypothetical protein
VRKALHIAAVVLAVALCGTRHYALAQDEQPPSGATEQQATDSGKSDRAFSPERDNPEADDKQEDTPETACVRELATAEEAFQSKLDLKALSEADAEKLIQLLDDADAACTEGDVRGAREKLETVNATVAKAK